MISPGKNIAIKVPLYKWEETVAFYRDKLGLSVTKTLENSVGFAFGEMTLWIDRVATQSQTDVWLELFTDAPDEALRHLESPKRDTLEPLVGVNGHWTSDPAGVILLLRKPDADAS